MASRIRLEAGTYRATDALVLSLYHGEREIEYREVKAGDEFAVAAHVNHYWSAVKYHPDFGDRRPRFERIG